MAKTLGWIFTDKGKIINYLAKNYYIDDINSKPITTFYKKIGTVNTHYHIGDIYINYKGDRRVLKFIDYICKEGKVVLPERRNLYIEVGKFGRSIEIIKELVDQFGGFMDNDNSDQIDIDYRRDVNATIAISVRHWHKPEIEGK